MADEVVGLVLLGLALAVLPPVALLRSRHAVDLARYLAAMAVLAVLGAGLVVASATSL